MTTVVKKRNGKLEEFNAEKINKVIEWACEGISDVHPSDVAMNAKLSVYNKISTSSIQDVIVQSAANLITEDAPNYQYVAARLRIYALRKDVWGGSEAPRLYDHLRKNKKIYDDCILEKYSESEIHKINKFLKHDRDYLFTYAGIEQMIDKYLICDRISHKIYETPQFAFILVPMVLFRDRSDRIELIKEMYDYVSMFKINLPTPILAGVRSKLKFYSSCVLADCGDSIDSIFTTAHIVGKYTARRSGIGVNMGRIRAVGSPIRNSEVISTGIIPFLKVIESAVKSTSQNGLRGGGATISFPWWHAEVEDILVLKNNRGTDDNRVRKLDYCIQLEKVFYDRVIENKTITLFCPNEVKGLYDSFGLDSFKELYEYYENDKSIKLKKIINARDLMVQIAKERLETGRIYIMNIDHVNKSPWKEKINMINLCVAPETMLLTKDGYFPISLLENDDVEVWNGKQWSKTKVVKTGENQKLVKVILSDGKILECTPYHLWYTIDNYKNQSKGILTEKRTHELKVGDKLCKFDLPIIDGNEEFVSPYTHGLYCADGCLERINSKRISLYGEKKSLAQFLDIKTDRGEDASGRRNIVINPLIADKFIVPINSSLFTKLRWLEGYFDGDGTIAVNGTNESIQAASVEFEFLKQVQLMLQTMGIDSKITHMTEAGDRLLPDGRGGYKLYPCRESKRILINSNGLYKLSQLGFSPNRLKFTNRLPQRDATQFVTVVDVIDEGRTDDTYCVNEPLEHKVVFNGILTGNCVEITQPTKPLQDVNDVNGEIGICILSAINLLEVKPDELENVCKIIVYALNELIDYQEYPFEAARKFCQEKRSLGVGLTNFAAWLASKKLNHESPESIKESNDIMEKVQYYLLSASCQMAEEKGAAKEFSVSHYSNGFLPCDKPKNQLFDFTNTMDWEILRERIKKFGLRNCTLTAQMPCESSSVVQCSTNGLEPIRSLLIEKEAKNGVKKVLTPKFPKMKNHYTRAFDLRSNDNILKIYGAMQYWIDMAMSVNTYLNYNHYPDGKIPHSIIIKDIMLAHKYGIKTLYYNNTPDDRSEGIDNASKSCESGACSI